MTSRKMPWKLLGVIIVAAACVWLVAHDQGPWQGVDDTVVEKFAEEAGHPATRPFIDTDRGDLLLFVFLSAGVAGGFVMGYYYRQLFGRTKPEGEDAPHS